MTRKLLWGCVPLLAAGAALAHEHGPENAAGSIDDNALYVHLVINHLPIFGTLMGLLALLLALIWKSDASRRIAMILLLVSTAGAWPVFQSGQNAYEDGRIIADDPGEHW